MSVVEFGFLGIPLARFATLEIVGHIVPCAVALRSIVWKIEKRAFTTSFRLLSIFPSFTHFGPHSRLGQQLAESYELELIWE